MKRIFNRFTLTIMMAVLVVGLVGILVISANTRAASSGVVVTLSVSQTSFGASDAVMTHVTIRNPGAESLRLLSWNTPANGVQTSLFSVTRDGALVTYLGMLVKRAAPTEKDYITLAAGKSLEYDVNLSDYYSFAESGQYVVKYNTFAESLYASSVMAKSSGELVSNELRLNVTGRPDPAR